METELVSALQEVLNAPREHPIKNGATFWAVLLTPKQLAFIASLIEAYLVAKKGGAA